jgi:hypothetical protein
MPTAVWLMPVAVQNRTTRSWAVSFVVAFAMGLLPSPTLAERHNGLASKQFDDQYEWTRCTSISRCAPMLITLCSRLAKLSNNMIQKELAFGSDWSGSVVNSGR